MIHLFHKWTPWEVKKEDLWNRKLWIDESSSHVIYQFYRIHERRRCLHCNKIEYRIRDTS